jgi:TolB-like protein
MSLFAELKSRNVFKIGIAYLIVAWLLMQVAALAVPALLLPDWVTTLVVFLLLLGFPVALLLAWAYEVTPEGVKKTKNIPATKRASGLAHRKLDFLVIGLLSIAVIILVFENRRAGDDALTEVDTGNVVASSEPISIAVLPFANMSDDPNQEHFADGLTEELLNSLAAIDDLRVISRTSSFSFKGQNLPITEIASQLGVDHILEGSVRRAGDRVRVTAQLIETSSDSHLWSENYDRELTVDNILDIQEEVAVTVVQALHARLTPDEAGLLDAHGPASLAALDLYHDGLFLLNQIQNRTLIEDDDATYEAAIDKFTDSIDLDPDWAPAHAALGRVYHYWISMGNEDERLRLSKAHIENAIRLDDEYGPAYVSLGFIHSVEENYEAAFDAYDRANALGSESPGGRAILLYNLARYDEAIELYKISVSANPMGRESKNQLAYTLSCAGRYDELIEPAKLLVDLGVADLELKVILAEAYAWTGDVEKGMALGESVAAEFGQDSPIAYVLALAGLEDRALPAVTSSDARSWWSQRASAAVHLADASLALDVLEQTERYAPDVLWDIRCSPAIRSLAGNPRYDALIERLDLPE